MKIAVLGLGIIGSVWADNLREDGHEVRAWNRTPKPDYPGFEPDVATAVTDADFIFLVVADPAAVEAVLKQALPVLKAGQVLVQSSTISPHWTLEFAKQVEATGAEFLEAPFTGSKPAAIARQCVYYLGGTAELLEKARPVLERLAKAQIHVGETGSASALKLAMNLNIAGVAQALIESLSLARKCGLSDDIFFEALELNVSKSGVATLKEPKLREDDFSPQFSVKHLAKDLRLALETAKEQGLEIPHTGHLHGIYEEGMVKGWGDDDFISLVRLLARNQ
ncbi:NAD(P)-dependent oxidoreductase [bacterium]|nr:MAG: NAD(P)-dependent oxidoreductase [bacterium]